MFKYYWFKVLNKLRGSAIKNSNIGFDSKVEPGTIFLNSSMGRYSFCGYDCFVNNCEIGSFVSIADRVSIGRGMHPIEWASTSPVFYDNRDSVKTKFSRHKRNELPKTIIGNDVWIGDNVLIKAGVKIGDGAVVGMGSVVTKDVEPYAIVAGVPARVIRYRFSKEIIEELKKSKWWNQPDNVLNGIGKYVQRPEKFIVELQKLKDEKKGNENLY